MTIEGWKKSEIHDGKRNDYKSNKYKFWNLESRMQMVNIKKTLKVIKK